MSEKNKPHANLTHVFAIVRFDAYDDESTNPQNKIAVVRVVQSEVRAREEVERLQEINKDKGSLYFYQITRMEA